MDINSSEITLPEDCVFNPKTTIKVPFGYLLSSYSRENSENFLNYLCHIFRDISIEKNGSKILEKFHYTKV